MSSKDHAIGLHKTRYETDKQMYLDLLGGEIVEAANEQNTLKNDESKQDVFTSDQSVHKFYRQLYGLMGEIMKLHSLLPTMYRCCMTNYRNICETSSGTSRDFLCDLTRSLVKGFDEILGSIEFKALLTAKPKQNVESHTEAFYEGRKFLEVFQYFSNVFLQKMLYHNPYSFSLQFGKNSNTAVNEDDKILNKDHVVPARYRIDIDSDNIKECSQFTDECSKYTNIQNCFNTVVLFQSASRFELLMSTMLKEYEKFVKETDKKYTDIFLLSRIKRVRKQYKEFLCDIQQIKQSIELFNKCQKSKTTCDNPTDKEKKELHTNYAKCTNTDKN